MSATEEEGDPKNRWEGELIAFVARTHGLANWVEVAAKAEVWRSLEAAFLKDKVKDKS